MTAIEHGGRAAVGTGSHLCCYRMVCAALAPEYPEPSTSEGPLPSERSTLGLPGEPDAVAHDN